MTVLLRFLQCKFGKGRLSGLNSSMIPICLRLCLKEKRMRACVHIYSMMSMHEEAVALALQEAICSSLEDYNKQIEQLKQEMNDATYGADNIRNDISALAQRYAVIDCDEDCGVCQKKILIAS
ncbi:Vacuolar sorting protein 18 [Camellia lanceoleosa]|uniref:Vacuolar sorting protein 18 n=1 Tax=Camellia lanceoleosa TaxID=1840588 RepID=A0ACC0GVC1_9ERIC|nr:Vacuolar sorting protein 18 [Camellia lanceoleosa]